ncbi:hypothetical protein [Lysinibacillus antri]|uniref:DUF2612 domain-containing protein n=1 Tax=Lysinibacillus antri TaxID=2498145 RepID=A0A432LHH5_9BACI|nr:hypothetical protein [Lysinibacillus antri]RUL56453.1 hypothetical protein EK386_02135 [Lysinibacillus antri]
MFSLKSVVSRFTDYFEKQPNSNISKLMKIFNDELQSLNTTIERVGEWKDIDKAEGLALDDAGTNIKQPRGVATDEVYRILLKSKIARNLSDGSINTIIQVLATALSCEYKDIKIKEKWTDDVDPEPAAIQVIELPLIKINEAGLDPANFARIIQRTVAGGIKVGVIELTGTFEFGDESNSIDTIRGFGDVNNAEIGGYLGAAYTPSTDQELPI